MANLHSGSLAEAVVRYKTRPPRGPSPNGGFLIGWCPPYKRPKLPDVFALSVKDSGMAPMLNVGEEGIFTTEAAIVSAPEPGACILVGTIFGPEIRQFEPMGEGHWAACALNSEYEDIRTTEEAAWVIAVLVGVRDMANADSAQRVEEAGHA